MDEEGLPDEEVRRRWSSHHAGASVCPLRKELKVCVLLRLTESHAALAARPQGDRVPAAEADAARPGRLRVPQGHRAGGVWRGTATTQWNFFGLDEPI